MSEDLVVEGFTCNHCGAPLRMPPAAAVLRCLYCGSDHRLAAKGEHQPPTLQSERRLGTVIGPYLVAPVVGFISALATHDWLYSPYEGVPAITVGVIFVLTGLLRLRMAAVLGLGLIGISGILKPFVRPIRSSLGEYYSPTSETAFYYLVPGVIAVALAAVFLASLRIRDVAPALRALVPRAFVVVGFVLGLVGGHLLIGDTFREVLVSQKARIDALAELSLAACKGELADDLASAIEVPPKYDDDKISDTIFASCHSVADPEEDKTDPLYLGDVTRYTEWLRKPQSWHQRGIGPYQRRDLDSLSSLRYLVVYRGSKLKAHARVVDIEARSVIRQIEVSGEDYSTTRHAVFAELSRATGGTFRQ